MAAEGEVTTAATWDTLPDVLVLRIMADVPVDTHLRCSEVRRGWHALLRSPAAWTAWTRLDLSCFRRRVTSSVSDDAVVRGFASKAAGALASLDVSGLDTLTVATLLDVVTANAATLRELRTAVRACVIAYASHALGCWRVFF
jgi:hypothetical protein